MEEVKTTCLVVGVFEAALWAVSIFVLRERLAQLYSSDVAVIALATGALLPYLTHNLFDGVNGNLQAALRGCGRQTTTAKVSLTTWYGLALPLGWALCFLAGMGIVGLWTGLMVGAVTTCIIQWFILKRLDWPAECEKAAERKRAEQELEDECSGSIFE
jgi:multidrug resistance protein, MATE family